MIKNISQIKATVDGFEGIFLCEMDTPTYTVKAILSQFQQLVEQMEEASKNKAQECPAIICSEEIDKGE